MKIILSCGHTIEYPIYRTLHTKQNYLFADNSDHHGLAPVKMKDDYGDFILHKINLILLQIVKNT